ncbi:MAG: High-affinity nickel transporter, partial [Pseudomonadota bacterium]|nr:High-affinity nickel transporter [Pseudomonadota bacterium]
MTLVLAAFFAGFVHVLSGPDHLAAIAPYALDGKKRAWRTGVRWGFGHATGALTVGLLMLVLREALPVEAVSAWGEHLVGLALIAIGIWGARAALIRAAQPVHAHASHAHGHAALAVG